MCANYTPTTDPARLFDAFGVRLADELARTLRPETWPGYEAPFVRRRDESEGLARGAAVGLFGMVPHWAKDPTIGRRTYNARSETASGKPSFRDAWRLGRRCIVPAESFFEPCWETGKAVRWRIRRRDGRPLAIAGLWTAWRAPDGRSVPSFTMLTVNADGHELMRRFHKPEDEKRMVVLLDEADFDAWLDAPQSRMSDFMRRCPADALECEPAPKR